MANPIPPIPYKVSMLDKSGLLTAAWSAWFREVFSRVGGTTAPSNTDIQDSLDVLSASISATQASLAAAVSDLNQGSAL